jgi:NAD(P)-dependent dehydrogenase (short-subunit alcohol dehydrogenase family)
MKDLAGKTAFVTGAASGIGLGIATALAQAGVKVMLCDVEEAALDRAVQGLKETNADVDGVKADVSLKAELTSAVETMIGRYGKVHILVNNAGVGGGGPAIRVSEPFTMIQERVSNGVDPSYVGELVREGIEKDWPHLFTDVEFEPMIEARFAAIKQGFDRIRGREPRR